MFLDDLILTVARRPSKVAAAAQDSSMMSSDPHLLPAPLPLRFPTPQISAMKDSRHIIQFSIRSKRDTNL